jgi:hypothetical protein
VERQKKEEEEKKKANQERLQALHTEIFLQPKSLPAKFG